MTHIPQSDKIVEAVHLGVISEHEAVELLVALKHGDHKAVKRLMEEHKKVLDKGIKIL